MCICYNPLTIAFLSIFLLAGFISATPVSNAESEDRVFFRWRYKVHILNGMPDNVTRVIITCHSNDDDLGVHTLFQGQEFRFEFITSFFKKTHFVCNFFWGVKSRIDVSVFDDVVETGTCRQKGNCFWKAAPAGIYFSSNYQYWDLKYSWNEPNVSQSGMKPRI